MKKETTPRSVQSFLTRLLVIPILVLWLVSMFLLSTAVAKDMYYQLERESERFVRAFETHIPRGKLLPGQIECERLKTLRSPYSFFHLNRLLPVVLPQRPSSYSSRDLFYGKWELLYGYQAAVSYLDPEGTLQFVSGDYLWFSYGRKAISGMEGYAYIDLSTIEGGQEFADRYLDDGPIGYFANTFDTLRLTGYFEGNRFHPVTITSVINVGFSTVSSPIFETAAPQEIDLVTIYTHDVYGTNYEPGPAFSYGGVTYKNAADFLIADGDTSHDTLFRSVIRAGGICDDGTRIQLAVSFSPLGYAALRLLPCYLISGLGVLILLVLLLKKIRQQLTEPLAVINRGYENNRVELSKYADSPLLDLQMLARHFNHAQQDRHRALAQLQPLQTALDYARDGEEHRKKMVSAIAHELKTPLAIIHSYAEGLQTGIAKEKQDRYLSVILEETERMDALVLETLELSRLEAGKVRLSTDQFSLAALTREVFDRLAPALDAKQLQVRFSTAEEHLITADEARIHQVITNFATNAIKYSPMGGEIRIQIYRYENRLRFLLFNRCAPLSQEQLTQVWDTFYRTEESRTTDGTGLGLAIAKNIISLHRGECIARNAEGGVEFGFSLLL